MNTRRTPQNNWLIQTGVCWHIWFDHGTLTSCYAQKTWNSKVRSYSGDLSYLYTEPEYRNFKDRLREENHKLQQQSNPMARTFENIAQSMKGIPEYEKVIKRKTQRINQRIEHIQDNVILSDTTAASMKTSSNKIEHQLLEMIESISCLQKRHDEQLKLSTALQLPKLRMLRLKFKRGTKSWMQCLGWIQ